MGKWVARETGLTLGNGAMQGSPLLCQHAGLAVLEVNPGKNQDTAEQREWHVVVIARALWGFKPLRAPALTLTLTLGRYLVSKPQFLNPKIAI